MPIDSDYYISKNNEIVNESNMVLFFNETERQFFFSSILSLIAPFLKGASFLTPNFPSPNVLWL